MIMTFFKAFGRLGGIVALILLVVALLRQLITLFGFLLAVVKIAIIVIFVALVIMILLAIWRDRCRRRREVEDL
jgi:L-asparagine transporter-like permease